MLWRCVCAALLSWRQPACLPACGGIKLCHATLPAALAPAACKLQALLTPYSPAMHSPYCTPLALLCLLCARSPSTTPAACASASPCSTTFSASPQRHWGTRWAAAAAAAAAVREGACCFCAAVQQLRWVGRSGSSSSSSRQAPSWCRACPARLPARLPAFLLCRARCMPAAPTASPRARWCTVPMRAGHPTATGHSPCQVSEQERGVCRVQDAAGAVPRGLGLARMLLPSSAVPPHADGRAWA